MENWASEPEYDEPHDHTARFLARLAPDGHATFQVYDETSQGRRELGRILHGTLAQHWRALKSANDDGAAVMVAVNETDGRGRRLENVVSIRAMLLDLDGAPLEPVLAATPQ